MILFHVQETCFESSNVGAFHHVIPHLPQEYCTIAIQVFTTSSAIWENQEYVLDFVSFPTPILIRFDFPAVPLIHCKMLEKSLVLSMHQFPYLQVILILLKYLPRMYIKIYPLVTSKCINILKSLVLRKQK